MALAVRSPLAPAPLLEREAEARAVAGAIEAAVDGRTAVVLLEGPEGVGTTRMLEVARAAAVERGFLVLDARCSPLERDHAFGVILQLLEAVVLTASPDRRAALLDGPATVTRTLFERGVVSSEASARASDVERALIHGLRWLIAGLAAEEERALALLVDDAHEADASSLRTLARVAAVGDLPLAVVLTARSDAPASEALAALGDLALRVPVRPLSIDASAALVRALAPATPPELVAACARLSAGRPLAVRELLQVVELEGLGAEATDRERLGQVLPDAVRVHVDGRLAQLGPHAAALAEAAAVLGSGTPLRLVAALAELPSEAADVAADGLAAAQLVEPGDPLRFTHAVVLCAVRGRLGEQALARAHRRAAALLEGDGAATEVVADHLLRARPDGDAHVVDVLREAARASHGRGDADTERRLLARALAEPPDARLRTELVVALALAEAAAGRPEAEAHVDEALRLVAGDEERADVLRALARVRFTQSRFDEAAEALDHALALVDGDAARLADVSADVLAVTAMLPRGKDLSPRLTQALATAQSADPPHAALQAFAATAVLLGDGGDPARAGELAAAALRRLADGDAFLAVPTGSAIMALLASERLADALAALDAMLDRAQRSGTLIAAAFAHHLRAEAHLRQGRLGAAIADSSAVLDISASGWDVCRGWIVPLLVRAHLARGDVEAARSALALAGDLAALPNERHMVLEAQGRLELAEGDPAAALRSMLEAGAVAGPGLDVVGTPWRSGAAQAAAQLGKAHDARRLAGEELALARSTGRPRLVAVALTVAGALAANGDGERALDEAVAVLEPLDAPLELADALVEQGAARRRGGRRADARDPLRRGLELADRLGAAPLAARARDELRAAGGRRRRPRAEEGVEALTPAQLRVARLAAKGHTSSRIAGMLHLTPKTVDWHLGQAYRKLGISSRRELAAVLGPQ